MSKKSAEIDDGQVHSSPVVEMELMGYRDSAMKIEVRGGASDQVQKATSSMKNENNSRRHVGRSKSFQELIHNRETPKVSGHIMKRSLSRKMSLKRNQSEKKCETDENGEGEAGQRRAKKIFNFLGLTRKKSQRNKEGGDRQKPRGSVVSGPENVNVYTSEESARAAAENYRVMAQHLREELKDFQAAEKLVEKAINILKQFGLEKDTYYGQVLFENAMIIAEAGREEEAQVMFVKAAQLAYCPKSHAEPKTR